MLINTNFATDKVVQKFLKTLELLQYGTITVETPDRKNYHFAGKYPGSNASLSIHNWRAITNLIAKGDVGLAEAYRDGWIDTDNLVNLLLVGLQNAKVLENYIRGKFWSSWTSQLLYFFRLNTIKKAKRNIHKHYDLGNDFYSLWLDPSMTYSSALFHDPKDSLEQAQYNKYDRILQRLGNSSGNLLEIGCGWGGFIERALNNGNDYAIKGITISDSQHQFAKERLMNRANITYEDYRIQNGKYDHIVSIEMFEAVGKKFWPVYFQKIKSLLKSKGKAVIQTICIDDSLFEQYQKSGDMIRTFIFPGGMLSSYIRFNEEVKKAGLHVVDKLTFTKDYVRTLTLWLQRFDERLPEIRKLNFDEKFIRIWRFYLASCIAGFATERTSVLQVELEHT